MGNRRKSPPSYRRHRASGQAIVTLSDRDFYLGPHGTKISREEYDRVVGEWLANGRQLPQEREPLTVGDVLLRYWEYAQGYYGDGSDELTPELYHLRRALRVVRQRYSREPAESFGPLALRACQAALVEDGLVRRSVNQHVGRIKRVFRWAVQRELVSLGVFHGLQAVEGLKRGRTTATEGTKVRPVPQEHIEAVLAKVTPTVAAMIRAQLLTGMRPGELVHMRASDIDWSVDPWVYRPEHHDIERAIFIGPQAQAILEPMLEVAGDGYVFSPLRSEEARNARRRLARRSPMTPSQRARKRKEGRKREWKTRYSRDSYRRAIVRACEAAGIPKWTPHRLRHNAATQLRKEFGLDAARVVLGHTGAETTAIYAEVDQEKAASAMRKLG